MKILVVGATGKFAGLVVPALKARGATVKALVTSDDEHGAAIERGADEAVTGNLNDEQGLRAACEGVEGVFHINPAFLPNEAQLGVAMVEAAAATGVRKFTFSSVIHPSISRMKNHSGKRPVEAALYESGMTFTVLQPTMFMQTIESGWKAVVASGRFALPYPVTKKASYVDYRDVAEAAAIALTTDTLDNGTFEVSAAGMLDRSDIARLMSDALKRTIAAGEISFDEWVENAHIPEGPYRDGMRAMYEDYARFGFPGGNALVLRAVLGREPRTLAAYLKELAARA